MIEPELLEDLRATLRGARSHDAEDSKDLLVNVGEIQSLLDHIDALQTELTAARAISDGLHQAVLMGSKQQEQLQTKLDAALKVVEAAENLRYFARPKTIHENRLGDALDAYDNITTQQDSKGESEPKFLHKLDSSADAPAFPSEAISAEEI